jgi:hypothetical protein
MEAMASVLPLLLPRPFNPSPVPSVMDFYVEDLLRMQCKCQSATERKQAVLTPRKFKIAACFELAIVNKT